MISFDGTLILVFISFFVFMFLMKKVYFEPIFRIKEERERRMAEDREFAQKYAAEYGQLSLDYEAGLKKARLEAHQVIQEIRAKAKASAGETVAQARQRAQQELEKEMEALAGEREDTYRQMEAERRALANAIIQKVTAGRVHATSS